MVFKNIEDEADASARKIGNIFDSIEPFSFDESFTKTLDKDLQILEKYISLTNEAEVDPGTLNSTLEKASQSLKDYIEHQNGAALSAEDFEKAQRKVGVALEAQDHSFSKCKSLIDEYNSGMKISGIGQEDFIEAVSSSNKHLGEYLKGLDGGKASTLDYAGALIKAKAATIGVELATAALNMAISAGLSLTLSALIKIFTSYSEKQKEMRENAIKAGNAAKEESAKIRDLYSTYAAANDAYASNTGSKEQLESATNSLLSALGYEEDQIDGLIAEYGSLDAAINAVTFDALKEDLRDLSLGYTEAQREFEEIAKENFAPFTITSEDIGNTKSLSTFRDLGFVNDTSLGNAGYTVDIGDVDNIEDAIAAYDRLINARDILYNQVGTKFADIDELSNDAGFKAISNMLSNVESQFSGLEEYIESINLTASQIGFFEITKDSGIPKTEAEFEALKNEILETSSASTSFVGSQDQVNAALDNFLSTVPDLSKFYNIYESTVTSVKDISDSLDFDAGRIFDITGNDGDFVNKTNRYISQITELQTALDAYQRGTFSNDDIDALIKKFPALAGEADNLDGAIIRLIGSMNSGMLEEFTGKFDNLTDPEDIADLNAFQAAVLAIGSTIDNYDFNFDIHVEEEGIEAIANAANESASALGLTSESISQLESRYKHLEGYDAAKLFEKTALGVQLNTDAVRELEAQYEDVQRTDIQNHLQSLVNEYESLTEQINTCSDAEERATLYEKRSDILDQIEDVSILSAQYEALTSSYNRWLQAQSTGNQDDKYLNVSSNIEKVKELYDSGLVGRDDFIEAVQFMTDVDLSNASMDTILAEYERGMPLMEKYFTNSTDGLKTFLQELETANNELGKDWITIGEDGFYDIDFGINGIEEVANHLGLSQEQVLILAEALQALGHDVDLSSINGSLDYFKQEAMNANEALKELGYTDITFDFSSTDIEDLNSQIGKAKDLLDSMYNEDGTINVNYSEEDVENAQLMIGTLLAQRQELENELYFNIDTSGASEEVSNALSKVQEFKAVCDQIEMVEAGVDIGVELADLETERAEILAEIQGIDADVMASINLDPTSVETLKASLPSLATVTFNTDTSEVDTFKAESHDLNPTVKYKVDRNAYDAFVREVKSTSPSATVRWKNDTSRLLTSITIPGYVSLRGPNRVNGTANVGGSAFAGGKWGSSFAGRALVGELGREIVVNPYTGRWYTVGDNGAEFVTIPKGAIIFNHRQTESILANGRITSGSPRGAAYASGTAFSGGSISGTAMASGSSSVDSDTELKKLDWIEVALSRIERAIEKLRSTADSAYKALKNRLTSTHDEISMINKEIAIQQKAYERYMQEANSIGLSSDLMQKVQDGSIEIAEYDSDTQDLINEYQEFYEKAMECSDAVDELHESLADLYMENFENIQADYENQLDLLSHLTESYETGIDMLEAKGYLESTKYYSALQDVEKENIRVLKNELADLEKSFSEGMASGEIEEFSDSWYEMQVSINDVKEEIDEANLSLLEYAQTMREVEWEHFDFVQERISQLTSEADFLIDLMSNSDLHDDQGNLTDEGMATLGLHGQNYNVYMAQADQYAEEIKKINEELANDPNNTELIERKEELLELQQESILAAEEEKQAMIELVREGIELELEAMQDLIDTYTDALDSAKDLYEYQKKVADQTKTISDIEKQLSAYENDTSEENRVRIQQLKVELEDARSNLEETEYDKYISDQKQLLDSLYLEYETVLNERFDTVDALVEEMIGTVNENATSINETLAEVGDSVGYTLSENMQQIWDGSTDSIEGVISTYGDGFNDKLTSINNVLDQILINVASMIEDSNEEAEDTIDSTTTTTEPNIPESQPNSQPPSPAPSTPDEKEITVGGKINAAGAKIYDYAGDTSGETQYYSSDPIYTVLGESNGYLKVRWHKLSSGITGWFKKNDVKAYKTGGLVDYTGAAWLDGTPSKPELVLNAQDTENFIALKETLRRLSEQGLSILSGYGFNVPGQEYYSNMPDFSDVLDSIMNFNRENFSTTVGDINVTIPIEHVEDYNDFVNQLRTDPRFEKMIQSMTVNQLVGGSSLAKNKYRW